MTKLFIESIAKSVSYHESTLSNYSNDEVKEKSLLGKIANLKLYLSPTVICYLTSGVKLELPILSNSEINNFFSEDDWYKEIANYNLIHRTIRLLKTLNNNQDLLLKYNENLLEVSLLHSKILKIDLNSNPSITTVITNTEAVSDDEISALQSIIDKPLEYPYNKTYDNQIRFGSPPSIKSILKKENALKELLRLEEIKNRPNNIDDVCSSINDLLDGEYNSLSWVKIKKIDSPINIYRQ